jgi:hypothetical protein
MLTNKTPSKLARNLYIAALTPMYIGGLVYTLIEKFMPYHAIAVGKSWGEIDSLLQVLIISALNAGGGLILCNAIAMTILLTIPFKRGELWASWAITSIGTATMLTVIRSAIHVDLNTPANPPWPVLIIVIVLLILALIVSIRNAKKRNQNW